MQDNQPENCPLCPKVFKDKTKLKVHETDIVEQNPSCVPFIDALRDLKSVYEISHQTEVHPNHREIINKFEMSMMKLHEKFAVPITPKLHIVFEHLSEYFELSGKTLRKKTDQTLEATYATHNDLLLSVYVRPMP